MIDANKFVWAYMIVNGRITTGDWSYYGSGWVDLDEYNYDKINKRRERMLASIKSNGIDWDKTTVPVSSTDSLFTDTFHPSQEVETLIGTLVLKDNSSYTIGVSNAEERFTTYAKSLMLLAQDQQRVKDILGE